jgi:protoporphyrinogen oxidase
MSEEPRKVVILGGGLTGISAALHLRQPWVLFEREAKLGGLAITEERDGFHFDLTGHWLHLRDPAIKQLVAEVLPVESRGEPAGRAGRAPSREGMGTLSGFPHQMVSVQRRARIFSHGVTTLYPFQANLYGLPPDVIKECLLGVIEAKLQTTGAEPRNFEEYCLRHFGAGISRHFMIPYNEKLWGVHPRTITADWCSRFVPLPNLEQVVAGAVGADAGRMGYNVSFLYPKQGGIETLTRALASRIQGGEVHLRSSVESLDLGRREVVVAGQRVPYRAVVATLPLPELLARISDLPDDIVAHAGRLRCTTLRYLNVATRSLPAADWHWVYVPEKHLPFYRVGIYSNAAASMAPPGAASLYVELADRGPVSDATLSDVAQGLATIGAISSPGDIRFADAREIKYAYVVFDEHYRAATTAIFRFLESHAIYSRGRYGGWTYNAMEDCLLAGREVAGSIEAVPGSKTS